ncbi:hypothetical protein [Ilyobacter polytropus]|uniref:hypothetical protein n=1 Tax=Ilyobacter polytropus TaxID=167642 RepID=UPI00165137D0|nr:hypothetical protein [Ilyobacter polytropus]
MKKHIVPLMNKVGHLSLIKSHAKLDKLGLYKGQPPLFGMATLFQTTFLRLFILYSTGV